MNKLLKNWFSVANFSLFLCIFIVNIFLSCQSTLNQSQQTQDILQAENSVEYWTGDGGSGIRLGILVPESQGLSEDLEYVPTMVQGVLVTNMSKYSSISVLDRVSLDRVISETLDLTYEDNLDIVRLGHVAHVGHMMTGNIIKTSTGYSMQINITDTTPQANTIASFSGNCTIAEFDNYSAIHRASLELLSQIGVQLTSEAISELSMASTQQSINAQTALARGVTAQRKGTEVEALSYFYRAAEIDPSLMEAESRSLILSANISNVNIGENVRDDIAWRRDWVARLNETEVAFYRMLNAAVDPPYSFFYSTAIEQGRINYQTETVDMSITINLHGIKAWFNSIQRAAQSVYDGLNNTGRKNDWGLGSWPISGVSETNPFRSWSYDFSIVFELLNHQGKMIGSQTFNISPVYRFSQSGNQIAVDYNENTFNTIVFRAINANDITDNLTIRLASVNGNEPEKAPFQITALTGEVWNEYRSGNGLHPVRVVNGVVMGFNPALTDAQIRQYRELVLYSEAWGESFVKITSIGERAFVGKGLTSVIIPESVTSINNYAFADNPIARLIIGNNVTTIGDYAFFGHNISNLIIPDSVRSIGFYAFRRHRSVWAEKKTITSVMIGANVTFSHTNDPDRGDGYALPADIMGLYYHGGRKAMLISLTGQGLVSYWGYRLRSN
ncbi:MAG: leucine-rich repeat domain-containing protein [Treponema sp.]|nr:leucine-rich repeat domain-containing protein [Treponema sp.]